MVMYGSQTALDENQIQVSDFMARRNSEVTSPKNMDYLEGNQTSVRNNKMGFNNEDMDKLQHLLNNKFESL